MAICVFYLIDWCPKGMNCKNEHIAYGSLPILKCGIVAALKGNQWPLSCFSPFDGGQNLPNFITDQSFEEVRFMCYEAKKQHNLPAYSQKFKREWTDARIKMNTMLSLNRKMVISSYNSTTPEQSGENNRSEKSESFAVAPGFGAKQKNMPGFSIGLPNKNSNFSFAAPSKNFNFGPMPANNPFTICTRGGSAQQNNEKRSDTLSIEAAQEKDHQPFGMKKSEPFAVAPGFGAKQKMPGFSIGLPNKNSNFSFAAPSKNFNFGPMPANNPFTICTRGDSAQQNNEKKSETLSIQAAREKDHQPFGMKKSEPFAVAPGFGAKQKNMPGFSIGLPSKNSNFSFAGPWKNSNFGPMPANNPFTICTRGGPAQQNNEKKSDNFTFSVLPDDDLSFRPESDESDEGYTHAFGVLDFNWSPKLSDITLNSDDFVNKVCANPNLTLFGSFAEQQNNQKPSDPQEKKEQPVEKGSIFAFGVLSDNKTAENMQKIDGNKEEQDCDSSNSSPKPFDITLNSDDFLKKVCANSNLTISVLPDDGLSIGSESDESDEDYSHTFGVFTLH